MFKRYDLDVFCNSVLVYSASFSSINNLVRFACGFDRNLVEFFATDTLFERSLPLNDLCLEMESNNHGI